MEKYLFSAAAILLFATLALVCPKSLANPDDLSETEERAACAQLSVHKCMSPTALQLSDQLGVMQLLARLQNLSEHTKHKHGNPISPESATLRLEVTEIVLTTMLQCQEVIAQIESEISEANEMEAAIQNKRDQAIKTNSIANVFANGLLCGGGTILQMPFETFSNSRWELPGEAVEGAGSLLSGALGGYALRQNLGAKLSLNAIKPNMLAKVFKRPNDAQTEYPDVIWKYLNTAPPDLKNGATRRQLLIERWEELGRIPPQNTLKGRLYMRTLAGTIPQIKTVTINMLDDRGAMLVDLKAEVAQIYKELLNMMLVVRAL